MMCAVLCLFMLISIAMVKRNALPSPHNLCYVLMYVFMYVYIYLIFTSARFKFILVFQSLYIHIERRISALNNTSNSFNSLLSITFQGYAITIWPVWLVHYMSNISFLSSVPPLPPPPPPPTITTTIITPFKVEYTYLLCERVLVFLKKLYML